ncbi:uncharacterized protein LOC799552 [Danio rerio]|uniref:LOC799552 protein n=1 Tax=Danio rerio TaxID=7955 RepID=B5DE32_DANRE|nr:uncharacterized protein LOC799552 [Danio rerio]AAI68508.1 LOC799552 protein [Danio rerio]|eukprot:NP_001128608.1 uncharacterized protein LOC799552 [Danio rerio]
MDDLDHSVLIAEQDWDCFCTESEECSVEQAKLAALDESGFSDSDDDKTSIHVSSLPITNNPDQHCEKDESLKQHQIGDCQIKHPSEYPENPNPETEPQNAEHMSNAGAHEQECQIKANEDNTLTEKLKENDENQENSEDKSNHDTTERVSEMSPANLNNGNSTDGIEMQTEVTESSAATIKEKERWFVTVNDSPVRLRVKRSDSVQKKRRKKKRCKNMRQNIRVMEDCSSLNNKTEADREIIERQTTQDTFEQENYSSDSPNIHNVQIQDNSSTGLSEDEEEKASCALDLKKENMTEIPKAKLERNPVDSPNSHLTLKQLPQMIFKDLSGSLPQHGDHESTARDKLDESIEDNNFECQRTEDNLRHFNNDTGTENLRFILGTAPSLDSQQEKSEQQEPLGLLSYNGKESSQETQSFKTPGPTPPIFAISSFWDEMEKLTINDILQIRIANSRSLPKENIVPEESSHVDVINAQLLERDEVESKNESLEDGLVDDMTDSDYFTHLDDSKPDRSSCEFSTFSDFDEEFIQLLHASANPSPDLFESKEQTFLESLLPVDLKETLPSESNEMVRMFPESKPVVYLYSDTEMQDFFLTTEEDNNMDTLLLDQCSVRRSTPSPVLSVSDILDDQCLLSFFEIANSDTELEQYQTWIPRRKSLLCFSQNVSLAETYDDFFSDFEVGNFLFPSLQGSRKSEKSMVPIYSSSRPVVRDLELSEVDEVIHENAPIRVMNPSETSNMCFITSQRSTWRNLSLRHTKLLMGRTWCRMATSWSFPKSANIVCNYGTKTTLSSSIAQSSHPVLLENQALGQMTEHKTHIGETVASADRDRFLFSLKQADMCLVCIAFASWVLKSSNPQSTDMWKTALLANVSAISAIQYLRRYVKEG